MLRFNFILASEDDEDENIEFVITPKHPDDITNSFESWLMSVDGRHKNGRSARQCCQQLLSAFRQVSPNEYNVSMLFDQIVLRNSSLNLFGKVRQPGTIRTYLNSLKRFYEFVLCDRPKTVNVTPDDCHGMMTSVSNW